MGRNIGENLRDLFDFQKFEGNKKLQGVIDSSLNATFGGNALSDDMLEFAAGGRETDDKVTEALPSVPDFICFAQSAGNVNVVERHRHRYEVNQKFLPQIEKGGLIISGASPDGELVEFVEAPEHRFFVATQAHPEFKSRPLAVHPLFYHFIKKIKEGLEDDTRKRNSKS